MREGFDDLLRGPGGGGRLGDVEVRDSAAVMKQDHEHIEHAERHGGYDEEVDGGEIGNVVLEERSPGLGGRFHATGHEPTNGAL